MTRASYATPPRVTTNCPAQLGTSLSDLTDGMGINRPSLYAAFGNKKSLFRKVLGRYSKGPSVYLSEALREPTAHAVVERVLHGVVDLLTWFNATGKTLGAP